MDAKDWFSDEAFWEAMYPFMFPESSYSAAKEQIGQVIARTGCKSGTVMDLACGPGRHAIALSERKYSVTGIDRSPFLLDKARIYARSAHVEVEWVHEDMRTFRRLHSFDLAICMFTSFGYFDEPVDNRTVLQNVHASLKTGGIFVLDVMGKEILARIFQPLGVQDNDTGALIQRRQIVKDWSRIEVEYMLVQQGAVRTFRLRHWLYSGAELRELLLSSGFAEVRLYGSLDGTEYGPAANRLIAIASKP